jgi:low affinity Fe/Cu permease
VKPPVSPPVGQGRGERQRWLEQQRKRLRRDRAESRMARPLGRRAQPAPTAPGWQQRPATSRLVHWIGDRAARADVAIVAGAAMVAWGVLGALFRFPPWWQTALYSTTGAVTFVMVFVIQHTQERQTAATQRKLDELIRSSVTADNTLIALEAAGDDHLKVLADLNLADRERATQDLRGTGASQA